MVMPQGWTCSFYAGLCHVAPEHCRSQVAPPEAGKGCAAIPAACAVRFMEHLALVRCHPSPAHGHYRQVSRANHEQRALSGVPDLVWPHAQQPAPHGGARKGAMQAGKPQGGERVCNVEAGCFACGGAAAPAGREPAANAVAPAGVCIRTLGVCCEPGKQTCCPDGRAVQQKICKAGEVTCCSRRVLLLWSCVCESSWLNCELGCGQEGQSWKHQIIWCCLSDC